MNKTLTEQIDDILPQTQCGLCEYNGCKPYAEAIAEQRAQINRCLPGGIETLFTLAALTQQNPQPFLEEMQRKAKPAARVVIREDECIGCTKCIQACPVDAILGAAKQMHTVIREECTGCELCIAPCPVDCIDLIQVAEPDEKTKWTKRQQARQRYQFRQQRLSHAHKKDPAHKTKQQTQMLAARKQSIAEAIARVKAKKAR